MTTSLCIEIMPSPLGPVKISSQGSSLVELRLLSQDQEIDAWYHYESPASKALTHYFNDPSYPLSLDLHPKGTPFQLKIWAALRAIPAGQTRTYGELAKQYQTSPRAIGQACRTNPILILIPCHRVIAANHIGGFSGTKTGTWLDIKKWLLHHEGAL